MKRIDDERTVEAQIVKEIFHFKKPCDEGTCLPVQSFRGLMRAGGSSLILPLLSVRPL